MPLQLISIFLTSLLAFGLPVALAVAQDGPNQPVALSTKPLQHWSIALKPEPQKGTTGGRLLDLMAEVKARLPEYQHHDALMNVSRSLAELQKRDDLCVLGLAATAERDNLGYFVGLWPLLPPNIVIRRADWQMINGGQPSVSLKTLLTRSDLHGASILQRTYGATADALLVAAEQQGQLNILQTSSNTNNLLSMLAKGRIDYTPEYPEMFVDSTNSQPQLREALLLLPMEEAHQPTIIGIYCSRTPRGEQMIRQLDAIARDPKSTEVFQQILNRYSSAENRKPYQQQLDEFYRARSERSMTNLPD